MSIDRLADLTSSALAPRLVVKDGSVRGAWLDSLVRELAEARARGQEVIVVSSGAIALGAAKLTLAKGGRGSLADAQAAAAVGQIALASLWAERLAAHGIAAAQLLVTIEDLEDRRRYLNAAATLTRLLKAGAVPVINENDSVATEEIRFGDNDRLAARVAQAAGADAVVLLSDVDGLYDRAPGAPGAQLLPRVEGVTAQIHAMATKASGSGLGSGGMTSKLQAAEIAERAGIALAIVNGTYEAPLARALAGAEDKEGIGTLFLRQRMRGSVTVDAGCAAALGHGGSLLATGITAVEGDFARGDPVAVRDREGRAIAQGLVEYTSAEVASILGRRSDELEALLGYAPRAAVIHRDQLVLL